MTDQSAPPAASVAAPVAAPAPPTPDKEALMMGFLRRIDAGEFEQKEDAFHRFVVKEIYPLLGAGTLAANDLERISRKYSAHADPYNLGYDTPEKAL